MRSSGIVTALVGAALIGWMVYGGRARALANRIV